MVLGFVLKSAGTQAGPTETKLSAARISVFGTIHPEIFRLGAPLGSEPAGERVRLASLEPQVGLFDAPTSQWPVLTDTAASACRAAAGWRLTPDSAASWTIRATCICGCAEQRRRVCTISLCASDCFTGFAPFASIRPTTAECTGATASLLIPTCWARTGSRMD